MGRNSYGPIPANDRAVRAEALKLNARERAQVRKRLQDYLDRTGLATADFGKRINYSASALKLLLIDRYQEVAGNSANICAAITQFIEAHPILPPTEVWGELYDTANVRALRQTFEALLRRPAAHMVYAPPGSQKSFVLEHLIAQLNRAEMSKNGHGRRAYYVYADVGTKPTQLIKEVAMACGVSSTGDKLRIGRNLRFEFQNRRVLLVLDEAQHLSIDCLEALRKLLDRPPHFSLLLSGSHDLRNTFDRFAARLEQWNSRIVQKVRLPGIEDDEAEGIVMREVGERLKAMTPERARKTVRSLIEGATSQDAYEHGRKYINIRTLTNALEQMKVRAEAKQ